MLGHNTLKHITVTNLVLSPFYTLPSGFGWTQGIHDHEPDTGNKVYVTESKSIPNYSYVIIVSVITHDHADP